MAIVNSAAIRKQLEPGLNALFGDEYKRHRDEWGDIFQTFSSDMYKEEEVKLIGLGLARRKDEGEAVQYDEFGERWTAVYVHQEYALGFQITQRAVEDNLYVKLSQRGTKYLARSFKITKEIEGASILNNGFTDSAPYRGGDGKPLFSSSHPTDVGNQSNIPSVAADLNETSLEEAFIAIDGMEDDRGLPMAARAQKLILPRQLRFHADRLLNSDRQAFTADNTKNVLKGTLPGGYAINHYLTDPDAWFLMLDIPDGLKHFQRVKLTTGMSGDFDTDSMKYKGRERYSFGWSDWRAAWGSAGA